MTRSERIVAAVVAVVLLAMLAVGAALEPALEGHSTHEQLGMPPCGFLSATGWPCPTCGMTTAVSLAAHGRPVRAFITQPLGALIALASAIGFWGSLHVAVFGSRLGHIAAPLLRPKSLWIAAGLWVASWAYKALVWTQ